ncbi:TPA: DUF2190 family protein [Morganella morganii]|uniref:DUF2190 family protein n=1 Tax=Morganella morganii TaxID=582 RepID=UPI000E651465|nr:capsid cement protein [Morganella morganii]ELA8728938.1 DUF2190 family protein [Morganella morganii]ELB1849250.1 DUF2190 family protein [Morganella morganii]ELT0455141.1 DUF2190 family protein [Morganella morganii]MBS9572362.1 DUF2190 family protein [Morganella morganii subsp. morganii]MBT0490688.1 DUF2190 family protein [Morganella morganii subsp. morganii]
MAKNYQQQGMTIAIVNSGTKPVTSGSLVQVGSLAAVAITDIAAGATGDGFAEGVFRLPKKNGLVLKAGAAASVKDGQLVDTGGVVIGVAWEDAAAGDADAAVKINVFPPAVQG